MPDKQTVLYKCLWAGNIDLGLVYSIAKLSKELVLTVDLVWVCIVVLYCSDRSQVIDNDTSELKFINFTQIQVLYMKLATLFPTWHLSLKHILHTQPHN